MPEQEFGNPDKAGRLTTRNDFRAELIDFESHMDLISCMQSVYWGVFWSFTCLEMGFKSPRALLILASVASAINGCKATSTFNSGLRQLRFFFPG